MLLRGTIAQLGAPPLAFVPGERGDRRGSSPALSCLRQGSSLGEKGFALAIRWRFDIVAPSQMMEAVGDPPTRDRHEPGSKRPRRIIGVADGVDRHERLLTTSSASSWVGSLRCAMRRGRGAFRSGAGDNDLVAVLRRSHQHPPAVLALFSAVVHRFLLCLLDFVPIVRAYLIAACSKNNLRRVASGGQRSWHRMTTIVSRGGEPPK